MVAYSLSWEKYRKMENRRIQLIALDLDGTLLNGNGEISEEDQKAICEASEKGIYIVVSTGRPYVGVPVEKLAPLGVRYAITTNGAAVYRVPEKECLYSDSLERGLACRLIRELSRYDVHFDVFIDGDAYSQRDRQHLVDKLTFPEATKRYVKRTRKVEEDLARFIEEKQAEVQKITVNFYPLGDGTYKDRDKVFQLFSACPQITFLSGGFHNLELTRTGVEKGIGLRFLADMLGISIEQTMACGDTQNDLNIMQTAGVGVAMENAEDEVKAIADFVTRSNDDSGVAFAIRQFMGER